MRLKSFLAFSILFVLFASGLASAQETPEIKHEQSFQSWPDPADPRHKWKSEISSGPRALFEEGKNGTLSWKRTNSSQIQATWRWDLPSGPWNYQTPSSSTWWASSNREGAIRVELSVPPAYAVKFFKALKRFKEPSKLRLHLELNPKIPQDNGDSTADTLAVPFANIKHSYKEPLLAETCELIRHWVRARQLLESPEQESMRGSAGIGEMDVECVLRWARSPAPSPSQNIVLTTLSLPLEFLNSAELRILPFVTAEDALSPSALQTQILK